MKSVSALAAAIAVSVISSGSGAAAPASQDPCARAGRDVCGTLGAGFYHSSRYGVRWFGDYRRAIAGERNAFCVDLGYWYASRAYRYRPLAAVLHDRAGRLVPAERRRRLAYAVWRYGRSSDPRRQAAVMLYVHAQMGDARPGELVPAELGQPVAALYGRIARDSARFHGPYRVEAKLPDELRVGRPATAVVRVLSARGLALPFVGLSVDGAGVPARPETNRAGVARITWTPQAAGELRLRIATAPLPEPEPRVYAPSAAGARAHGQRLVVPAARPVSASVVRPVVARPLLTATVSSPLVRPGTPVSERLRVTGLGTTSTTAQVEVYGPFGSTSTVSCSRRNLRWSGRLTLGGDSDLRTPSVALARSGFYAFRTRISASAVVHGADTGCGARGTTSLAVPFIVTGRGDTVDPAPAPGAAGATPRLLRVPALGIAAPVSPSAIDVRHGVLGIPAAVERVGWWRDGRAPGDPSGAVLIAGHVDSARSGAGALFRLRKARRGMLVRVATASGRSFAYRVASLREVRKPALPVSIYSPAGPPRLVLVTCGGPFDEATGHYRDLVIVTAVPAR